MLATARKQAIALGGGRARLTAGGTELGESVYIPLASKSGIDVRLIGGGARDGREMAVSLSARSGRAAAAAAAALVRQGGEGAAGMGGRWKAVRFRVMGDSQWGRVEDRCRWD